MALPPGVPIKTVTVGIASFFDGTLADGTATITAPVNVVHTPSNRPIFSSQMSQRFVDGVATFNLCPNDAAGLNRVDWPYKLNVVISGALVQPDPIYFLLPSAGPDMVDLDGLVTVPSSAGTPISVDVLTTERLPAQMAAAAADSASPFAVAQRGTFGTVTLEMLAGLPPASDTVVALDPEPWISGDITRDPATGAVISAALLWPDGTVGTYTADVLSARFPGTVDAYHVTKGVPTVVTYTQPLVSRDAFGNITTRPTLQGVYPALPYDFTADTQTLFDYDADILGADATAIAAWPSAAGIGTAGYTANLAQATGAAQPLVKAAAINGHKSALFDGVDDYLSSGTYAVARAQPVTILTVAKVTTTAATKWIYAGQSSASGNLEMAVTSGGSLSAKAGAGTSVAAAGTVFDAWHVFGAVFNGATTRVYRDAVTEAITGTVTTGDAASALGATRLGRSTGSVYFSGEVARHVAVGRALSSGEMRDAMSALGTLYGITIGA